MHHHLKKNKQSFTIKFIFFLPINNEAAIIDTILITCLARARNLLFSPVNKPQRANVPPSPRLSAIKINITYFIITTIIKFQIINDIAPIHCSFVGVKFSANIILTTYNGLVPISPNIIPSEPIVNVKNKRKLLHGETFVVSSACSDIVKGCFTLFSVAAASRETIPFSQGPDKNK